MSNYSLSQPAFAIEEGCVATLTYLITLCGLFTLCLVYLGTKIHKNAQKALCEVLDYFTLSSLRLLFANLLGDMSAND